MFDFFKHTHKFDHGHDIVKNEQKSIRLRTDDNSPLNPFQPNKCAHQHQAKKKLGYNCGVNICIWSVIRKGFDRHQFLEIKKID